MRSQEGGFRGGEANFSSGQVRCQPQAVGCVWRGGHGFDFTLFSAARVYGYRLSVGEKKGGVREGERGGVPERASESQKG